MTGTRIGCAALLRRIRGHDALAAKVIEHRLPRRDTVGSVHARDHVQRGTAAALEHVERTFALDRATNTHEEQATLPVLKALRQQTTTCVPADLALARAIRNKPQ
jgi:hypothetical protein